MAGIETIVNSRLKTGILAALAEGPRSSSELARILETSQPVVHHALSDLLKDCTVERIKSSTKDAAYALTNLGLIRAELLSQMFAGDRVASELSEFLRTHDISEIPPYLIGQIGQLSGTEIIKSGNENILRMQECYMSEMMNAKEIFGVAPVIMPGDSEAMITSIERGIPVSLILTEEIINVPQKENERITSQLMQAENFHLYSVPKARVSFTVTDSLLSLGLFRLDGQYDALNDLFCHSKDAVRWGKMLFQHYLERAVQIC